MSKEWNLQYFTQDPITVEFFHQRNLSHKILINSDRIEAMINNSNKVTQLGFLLVNMSDLFAGNFVSSQYVQYLGYFTTRLLAYGNIGQRNFMNIRKAVTEILMNNNFSFLNIYLNSNEENDILSYVNFFPPLVSDYVLLFIDNIDPIDVKVINFVLCFSYYIFNLCNYPPALIALVILSSLNLLSADHYEYLLNEFCMSTMDEYIACKETLCVNLNNKTSLLEKLDDSVLHRSETIYKKCQGANKNKAINNFNLTKINNISCTRAPNIRELGKGTYGTVFETNIDNNIYAVKQFDRTVYMLMEFLLIKDLPYHENILVPLGWGHNCLTFELSEEGDLANLITKGMTEDSVKFIMMQLVKGLSYLHGNMIAHWDIKPANILVFENNRVKYIDLGLGTSIHLPTDRKFQGSKRGTAMYTPPEYLDLKVTSDYDFLAFDIWSLGMIFLEMLIGKYPFKLHQRFWKSDIMSQAELLHQDPAHFLGNINDESAISLVLSMLQINPKNRITALEALNSDYIQSAINIWQ